MERAVLSQSPDQVRPLWAGATVAVLGGGPSLTPSDVDYVRGRAKVVAINNAVHLAPWADLLYFCDERWYRWHEATVRAFPGQRATLKNYHLRDELPGLWCLRQDGENTTPGLCESPDGLRTGSNSGYQVLNLLAHLGAARVVLLGFDMTTREGRAHWHPEHPLPTPAGIYKSLMLPAFDTLRSPLAARGLSIVNATYGSALTTFPYRPLREALL